MFHFFFGLVTFFFRFFSLVTKKNVNNSWENSPDTVAPFVMSCVARSLYAVQLLRVAETHVQELHVENALERDDE